MFKRSDIAWQFRRRAEQMCHRILKIPLTQLASINSVSYSYEITCFGPISGPSSGGINV